MHMTLWELEAIPWWIFAAYWAITALRVKRTKEREKSVDRLITLAVVVVAYELLFAHLHLGLLNLRFLPNEPRIAWAGIAITWVGVAVAIWARHNLGQYWSARVTLKEGHQLIHSGPYAYVRHPIYAGMLIGCIGATMVIGEWRGIVAVVLLVSAHSRKAMREESLLTTEFGEQYAAYRRRTGFLFPKVWNRAA